MGKKRRVPTLPNAEEEHLKGSVTSRRPVKAGKLGKGKKIKGGKGTSWKRKGMNLLQKKSAQPETERTTVDRV